MKSLIIIFSVLFLIFILLLAKIHFTFETIDGNKLYLRIFFIKIRLFPKKEKKIKLEDYSLKRIRKRKRKNNIKKASKSSRKIKNKKTKNSEIDIKSVIIKIIKTLALDFPKHVRTEELILHLTASGSDAASAALKFGMMNQFTALVCSIIDEHIPLRDENKRSVIVSADYTGSEDVYEIKITLSTRIVSLVTMLFKIISALFNEFRSSL